MNEKYDLIIAFHPTASQEKLDAFLARVEKKITASGGTVEANVRMGLRRVNTRMRKFKLIKDGLYYSMAFTAPPTVPREIEVLIKVNEDILRHILTRAIPKVEIEEKASEEKVEINPEMLIGKSE